METGVRQSVNNKPLISVIVPVYNNELYLSACIDSILGQTWPCMEIVIVDDGSTDNSGVIADRYKEEAGGKVIVLHQENRGVSSARKTGVHAATGDWIGFVDADDIIETDMYERLLENALESGAEISHCGYQTIVNDGERIHFFYNTGKKIIQSREEGLRDLLSGEFIEPSLCNKMFRRTVICKCVMEENLSDALRYHEDLLLNYQVFKEAKKSIYEDFCPYHYMSREKSATRTGFKAEKYTDPVRVWKWILEDVPENMKMLVLGRYLKICLWSYSSLTRHAGYTQTCDELKQEMQKYRSKLHLLRRVDRLRMRILMVSPKLYHFCETQYIRYFQKKTYE